MNVVYIGGKIKIISRTSLLFFLFSFIFSHKAIADAVLMKFGFGIGSDYFGLLGWNLSLSFKVVENLYVGPMGGLGIVIDEISGEPDVIDVKEGLGGGLLIEYFFTRSFSTYTSITYHPVGLRFRLREIHNNGTDIDVETEKIIDVETEKIYGTSILVGVRLYFSYNAYFINFGLLQFAPKILGIGINPEMGITLSVGFGANFMF
jgi:hypothetical protein